MLAVFQMGIDLTGPIVACKNLAILPHLDDLLALHQSDMGLELLSIALVPVRVRAKHLH
jgi:hypothetical protein